MPNRPNGAWPEIVAFVLQSTTMNAPALSCAEIRALEERLIGTLGIPSLVLMENAGRGAAELLVTLGVAGKVVVCCGKGNNGGDGLVLARHLDNRQIPVRVLLFAHPDELSPDAAVNYHILVQAGLILQPEATTADLERELPSADWVVDALFGTGLRGPLRSPFDRIVAAINQAPVRVLALDIPSGLDGDRGEPLGPTIRAQHTATFLITKSGFLQPHAQPWLGQLHLVDIGLPWRALS